MDPYKILEISPNASMEEIRTSYRRLVKKYHPDRYPEGAQRDFATEKIKQINAAYDMLTDQKNASFQGASSSGAQSANATATLLRVRSMIQANNLTAAAHLLDSMQMRPAEWYYLYGIVNLRRGWYDNARSCFETACSMDPANSEYQRAYQSVSQSGQPYSYVSTHTTTHHGPSGCDICSTLLCADCCCECMGGDCIRCC